MDTMDVDTKGWAGLSVQIHPQTHSTSLPEIQHIAVPIKQGWGRAGEAGEAWAGQSVCGTAR